MANHSATKKSIRTNARRTIRNTQRRSRIKTFLKKVEEAIESGDKKVANEALKTAQSEIMRGVSNGVIKLNTASRKISRLSARIKSGVALSVAKAKPASKKPAAKKKSATASKAKKSAN